MTLKHEEEPDLVKGIGTKNYFNSYSNVTLIISLLFTIIIDFILFNVVSSADAFSYGIKIKLVLCILLFHGSGQYEIGSSAVTFFLLVSIFWAAGELYSGEISKLMSVALLIGLGCLFILYKHCCYRFQIKDVFNKILISIIVLISAFVFSTALLGFYVGSWGLP